jgi:hypothetical protein
MTGPVVTPAGTANDSGGAIASIAVAVQFVTCAVTPLNVTEDPVADDPKLIPTILTKVPGSPVEGDRLVIVGVGKTVNDEPPLETPFTVTTTLPVVALVGTTATIDVALQLVIVAVVPLNVTVPTVVPKFVPMIVTEEPTTPEVG